MSARCCAGARAPRAPAARAADAPRLHSCGYSVTTADGGKAALRLLNETPDRFALVLSDVQMPDMDGFRLMECMALELDVPVISASPQRRAAARGRAGATFACGPRGGRTQALTHARRASGRHVFRVQ